jgi:hypothetical protein
VDDIPVAHVDCIVGVGTKFSCYLKNS